MTRNHFFENASGGFFKPLYTHLFKRPFTNLDKRHKHMHTHVVVKKHPLWTNLFADIARDSGHLGSVSQDLNPSWLRK